jgi:DNA-binding response OmpR family regulator
MANPDHPVPIGAGVHTVLVVDDEILIRFQISSYLRDCGYRVIEAADIDEAMIVLNEPGLAIDLVLSNVGIGGRMDGFGLARWLRANKPEVPVILVGSPARAAEVAADLCETGPMMTKPYESEILLDRIKRTLAERGSLASGILGNAVAVLTRAGDVTRAS